MNIDIETTFNVILILLAIGIVTAVSVAVKSIVSAKKLEFYRKRQDLAEHGWRLIIFSILLAATGFFFYRFGQPIAYRYFPPSATITRTPTITTTPTITKTLVNTLTPTITLTLAQTYTPGLPVVVQETHQTPIDSEGDSIFGPVSFSTEIDEGLLVNTTDTFKLPITELYAGYQYDKMLPGLLWTAIWLHEGEIVCYESQIWENFTGGYYFSDYCSKKITPDMWVPGNWEVQIFVGQTWKTSGRFMILSNEPTGMPSEAATASPTLTSVLPLATSTPAVSVIMP